MGFISNTLGEGSYEGVKLSKLADAPPGQQLSLGYEEKPENPSVSFGELEYAYKMDAINFSAINKSVQMIMAGGFQEFIFSKASVAKKYKEFFDNIGEVGGDITFEELFEAIFRDEMIYGNAFVEIIFNATDKVVDLAIIDPKKIDYAKTSDGKIVLDRSGKPLGYTIKFTSASYAEGDAIPEPYERHITKPNNSIFILYKKICHFKLYPVGDRFYGTGLIEPAYKSIIYKKNIEKGQANSIYLRGFNPLVAYVGNERKMATPKDIESVNAQVKEIKSTNVGTFPDWVKVDTLKMDSDNPAESALNDMRIDQFASLGTPEGLVSKGEGVNKSTLGDQRTLWEFTLKDIVKQTSSHFKKYILKTINSYNDFGGVPDMTWGELRAEDLDNTIGYIIRLLTAKSSHITEGFRNDIEQDLRELMNVEALPENKSKKKILSMEQNKPKPATPFEIKSNEIKAKEDKDLKKKLSSINNILLSNTEEMKKLKLEKDNLEKEYNENKTSTKEKLMMNQIKALEEKIDGLDEDALRKLSERDKVIDSLSSRLDTIKKEEESANIKLDGLKLNKLFEERRLKILEKKENLIKKLEEDLENGK